MLFHRPGEPWRPPAPVPALLEPVEYLNEPAPADPRGSLGPALRRHAAARLPEHMVPGAFVFLDRLPLGPTGKLNTRALPEPGDDVAVSRAAAEPPRTPLETTVAGIWAEVLGIPAIGIRDNFFEVGGHSLLATRVIARVRAGLGVEVPLRLLFERPNVADFALALAERLGTEAPVADDAIPPADRSKPALGFVREWTCVNGEARGGELCVLPSSSPSWGSAPAPPCRRRQSPSWSRRRGRQPPSSCRPSRSRSCPQSSVLVPAQ